MTTKIKLLDLKMTESLDIEPSKG